MVNCLTCIITTHRELFTLKLFSSITGQNIHVCWHGKSTHLSVDTFIGTGNVMRMMPGVSDLPCPSHFGGVLGVGVARHHRKCNTVMTKPFLNQNHKDIWLHDDHSSCFYSREVLGPDVTYSNNFLVAVVNNSQTLGIYGGGGGGGQ